MKDAIIFVLSLLAYLVVVGIATEYSCRNFGPHAEAVCQAEK